MVVNTANIGFDTASGEFQRYTPPGVTLVPGGHSGPPVVDATPLVLAMGETVPAGVWMNPSGSGVSIQINTDPSLPGQAGGIMGDRTFVSTGTNVVTVMPTTLYRVRG